MPYDVTLNAQGAAGQVATEKARDKWSRNKKPSYNPKDALRDASTGGYRPPQQYNQMTEEQKRYTEQPQGWDYSTPGVGEQYWDRNQGRLAGDSATSDAYRDARNTFAAPGQGEQYWNQVQGKFNAPTNAQGAYNRMAQRSSDPGLGAYYDRAKERSGESISNSLAAMGLFGSSVGGNQMSDAMVGLDAERANREADYVMRQDQALAQAGGAADSSNQSQWGLGGQLSGNAQSMAQQRGSNYVNAATAVDDAELARFNAGSNAALAAQEARRQRGQDAFGNMYSPAAALAGMAGQTGEQIVQGDAQYLDAIQAAEMGQLTDAQANALLQNERRKDDDKHFMDMGASIASMSGGGGGMGGAASGSTGGSVAPKSGGK